MRRGKADALGWLFLVIVAGIAAVPKEVWIIGGLAACAWLAWRWWQSDSHGRKVVAFLADAPQSAQPAERTVEDLGTRDPDRYVSPFADVPPPSSAVSIEYLIPLPPAGGPQGRVATHLEPAKPIPAAGSHKVTIQWIPKGAAVTVRDISVPGGMLYVGGDRSHAPQDPAVINPSLPVAPRDRDGVKEPLDGYWPSYVQLTPEGRRTYLDWLAGGRRDRTIDIGYVFLYFYGLERRLLVDLAEDPAVRAEVPTLIAELKRLVGLYDSNGSFKRYASSLIEWATTESIADDSYLGAPPPWEDNGVRVQVGVGQAARAKHPLTGAWALAWLRGGLAGALPTAAFRCKDEFDALFLATYAQRFPSGLRAKAPRSHLKLGYRAASGALRHKEFMLRAKVPDMSSSESIGVLRQIAADCAEVLSGYSRLIGRNQEEAGNIATAMMLPAAILPAAARQWLEALRAQCNGGFVITNMQKLFGSMGVSASAKRDRLVAAAQALKEHGVRFEPDIVAGRAHPKVDESIAVFVAADGDEVDEGDREAFHAAGITVDLACAAVQSDGKVEPAELRHLAQQIKDWAHLSASRRTRLLARLRLGAARKSSAAKVKKALEPLSAPARQRIAQFLVHLTMADGDVSPGEVRFLENTYQLLGLDPKRVYTDLHNGPGLKPAKAAPTGTPAPGALDAERIAQLQADTAEVTRLLADVFAGDDEEIVPAQKHDAAPDVTSHGPLGMIGPTAAFLDRLLTQPQWARAALEDLADQHGLMLDGTLEAINEASLDQHGAPLLDGEDPVALDPDITEILRESRPDVMHASTSTH